MSALDAMQEVQAAFMPDEVYAHLRSFEETLKQIVVLTHASNAITFFAHKPPKHIHFPIHKLTDLCKGLIKNLLRMHFLDK
jgi:hypothetical protein